MRQRRNGLPAGNNGSSAAKHPIHDKQSKPFSSRRGSLWSVVFPEARGQARRSPSFHFRVCAAAVVPASAHRSDFETLIL